MKYKKLSVFDQKSLDPETVSLDTAVNDNMFVPSFTEGTENFNIAAGELKSDKEVFSHIFNLKEDFEDIVPTSLNGWNDWNNKEEPNISSLDITFDTISDKNKDTLKQLIKTYNAKEPTEEEGKYNYKAIYLKVPVRYSEAGFIADFDNYIIFNLTNVLFREKPHSDVDSDLYVFQFSSDNYTHTARAVPEWDSTKNKVNTAFIQFEVEVVYETIDEVKEITDIILFKILGNYFKNYTPMAQQLRVVNDYQLALPIKSSTHEQLENITSPLSLERAWNNNYIKVNTKNEFETTAMQSYMYCGTMITTDTQYNSDNQQQLCINDINTVNCPYYSKGALNYYQPIHKTVFAENMTDLNYLASDKCRNFTRINPIKTKVRNDYEGGRYDESDIYLYDHSTVYIKNKLTSDGSIHTTFNLSVSAEFIGNFTANSVQSPVSHEDKYAYFEPIIGAFCYNKYFPSKFRRTFFPSTTTAIYLTSATQVLHTQGIGLAIKGHYLDLNHIESGFTPIPFNVGHNEPYIKTSIQLNGMNNQKLLASNGTTNTLSKIITPDDYYNRVSFNGQNYDNVPALLRADNLFGINMGYDGALNDPSYVNTITIVGSLEVDCFTPSTAL